MEEVLSPFWIGFVKLSRIHLYFFIFFWVYLRVVTPQIWIFEPHFELFHYLQWIRSTKIVQIPSQNAPNGLTATPLWEKKYLLFLTPWIRPSKRGSKFMIFDMTGINMDENCTPNPFLMVKWAEMGSNDPFQTQDLHT